MTHLRDETGFVASDSHWHPRIPKAWTITRLRHVAKYRNSNVDKKSYPEQQEVQLCNYTDVYYSEFLRPGMNFMTATAAAREIENFELKAGDVIITKDSEDPADIGIPALVTEDMSGVICGYHLTVIRAGSMVTSRFLHRLLQSHLARTYFFVEAPGVTRYGLNQEAIGNVPIALPSASEMQAIADLLDRETTRIDTLIEKKTRFIELLKEKRAAVITHAVTKGLDPDVPMKDSGVEWLGEIPAHWVTPALSCRYTSDLGKMLDTARISGDYPVPYLRNADVQWGRVNLEDLPVMDIRPSEYDRYTVKPGDLLVCEGGEVGRTAIMPQIYGALGFQKALHRLRAANGAENPRFMFYTMSWAASRGVFTMAGMSTIAHLTGEQLRRYRFPTPPPEEQSDIAAFLDREIFKIDTLISLTERSIELLKEKRSALITAAVTGKIDVRAAA